MRPPPILRIAELFPSIKGEGLGLGEPALFLRLAGCNRRCAFCDSKKSWGEGREFTTAEAIRAIKKMRRSLPCRWVCLTGGEPLLQDTAGLIRGLRAEGFLVHVETNGSVPRPPAADWYSVSPKPPDYRVDPAYLRIAREVKLVVTRRLGLGTVRDVRGRFPEGTPLLLQPQSNLDWSVRRGWSLVRRSLAEGLPNIRLGIQAHRVFKLP